MPDNDGARRCLILGLCDPPMTQQSALAQILAESPEQSHAGLASHLLRNFRLTHRPEEADAFMSILEANQTKLEPAPDVQVVDPKIEPLDPTLKFDPDEPEPPKE